MSATVIARSQPTAALFAQTAGVIANDAQQAWVERVLGVRLVARDAQAPAETAAVRLAKGLGLWNQTRMYVGRQVKALQNSILEQTLTEPDFPDIKANIGRLEAVLEVLDDRLTLQLGALQATTDPAAKQALSAEAREIVEEHQRVVADHPLLNEIDDNGFLPLDIKKRVDAALAAVLTTI